MKLSGQSAPAASATAAGAYSRRTNHHAHLLRFHRNKTALGRSTPEQGRPPRRAKPKRGRSRPVEGGTNNHGTIFTGALQRSKIPRKDDGAGHIRLFRRSAVQRQQFFCSLFQNAVYLHRWPHLPRPRCVDRRFFSYSTIARSVHRSAACPRTGDEPAPRQSHTPQKLSDSRPDDPACHHPGIRHYH